MSNLVVSKRLVDWVRSLDEELLERECAIRVAVLGLLSGQHVLVLGAPGTAKTLLAQRVAAMFDGRLFVTMLTRFSTPEDLFGPLSLKKLEEGVYERLPQGFLPEAEVAFVDEIFKANASILNAMLSILNERRFFNGATAVDVPLMSMLAASNELPDDDEGLEALDDRLLLRVHVEPLRETGNFARLLQSPRGKRATTTPPSLRRAELDELRKKADTVELPDEIVRALLDLRAACKTSQLFISDRRWRQAMSLLATCAAIDNCDKVEPGHLGVLRFVLWRKPEEQVRVAEALAGALRTLKVGSVTATTQDLLQQLVEVRTSLDGLLKRWESARQSYYGRQSVADLAPEAFEAERKANVTVIAAREVRDRMLSALAGQNDLWRPFWADVVPKMELDAKIDAIKNHRFLSTEVMHSIRPPAQDAVLR